MNNEFSFEITNESKNAINEILKQQGARHFKLYTDFYGELDVINYKEYQKLEKEKDKEIERLRKREKKWEKWTTEKEILSTKMSEYLCKWKNIKREYKNQVESNRLKKQEIERLIVESTEWESKCYKYQDIIKELEKILYKRQLDDYDTYTANVVCDFQSDFKEILEELKNK